LRGGLQGVTRCEPTSIHARGRQTVRPAFFASQTA
jgi:hypothetical protein